MGEMWGDWGKIGGIWANRGTEKGQNRPPKRSMGELPPKSHPKPPRPDPRPTFPRRLEQLGPAEAGHGAVQAGIDPDLGGRGGSGGLRGGPRSPPSAAPRPQPHTDLAALQPHEFGVVVDGTVAAQAGEETPGGGHGGGWGAFGGLRGTLGVPHHWFLFLGGGHLGVLG